MIPLAEVRVDIDATWLSAFGTTAVIVIGALAAGIVKVLSVVKEVRETNHSQLSKMHETDTKVDTLVTQTNGITEALMDEARAAAFAAGKEAGIAEANAKILSGTVMPVIVQPVQAESPLQAEAKPAGE